MDGAEALAAVRRLLSPYAGRRDLIAAFEADPFGHHGPELRFILDVMRAQPTAGKWFALMTRPYREWRAARWAGDPPLRVAGLAAPVFTSLADIERWVFAWRWRVLVDGEAEPEEDLAPMPATPALLGYADRQSVRAGETIRFSVSASGPFRCDFVRLLGCEGGPDMPPFDPPVLPVPEAGTYAGRPRPVHAGSCIDIPGSAALACFTEVTLAAAVWPTFRTGQPAGILGTLAPDGHAGLALRLDAAGRLEAAIGRPEGLLRYTLPVPLALRRWGIAALSYDAEARRLALGIAPAGPPCHDPQPALWQDFADVPPPARTAGAAVIAAERDADGRFRHHFDGKIERPRILAAALGQEALAPPAAEPDPRALAEWDFRPVAAAEDLPDRSAFGHHGRLVHQPATAMAGLGWDGATEDWRRAPEQFAAIHFHHDDQGGLDWAPDVALTIPAGWPAGCYAARLQAEGAPVFHAPFYVRGGSGDVAFLAPTATYAAYLNYGIHRQMMEWYRGCLSVFDPVELQVFAIPGLGRSLYEQHPDGSERHYGSLQQPVLNLRPAGTIWNFQIDLWLLGWLEREAPGHRVLTDADLDGEGTAALDGVRVLVTGSHPEYWSLPMLEALDGFLGRGGRLMYLGGNGFCWAVDFHPRLRHLMELRRRQPGNGTHGAGEAHGGFTGGPCGPWRRLGRPEHALAGVGYSTEAFDSSAPYRRLAAADDPRARFIFDGVPDAVIGDFGFMGGASGLEIDYADTGSGTPLHALVLATSDRQATSYWRMPHGADFFGRVWNDAPSDPVRADMVFFETPSGGAVFSTGSICWGSSLPARGWDNNVARITANVLHRFRDPTPFAMPAASRG